MDVNIQKLVDLALTLDAAQKRLLGEALPPAVVAYLATMMAIRADEDIEEVWQCFEVHRDLNAVIAEALGE